MKKIKAWTHIRTSTCDRCSFNGSGVQFFRDGEQSGFVCKMCNPRAYDRTATKEITRWLHGPANKRKQVV